ncbi:hypothetical protein ABEX29_06535 [Brevibacillus porteri]|uniref:hypothetical protein n=1 Tax=Brevibacillus porteri TaxID=2126350 RepID=UPI003D243EA9
MKLSGGFLCTPTTQMFGERGKRRLASHDGEFKAIGYSLPARRAFAVNALPNEVK